MAMRVAIVFSLLLVAVGAVDLDAEAHPRHLRKKRHSHSHHQAHHAGKHHSALLSQGAVVSKAPTAGQDAQNEAPQAALPESSAESQAERADATALGFDANVAEDRLTGIQAELTSAWGADPKIKQIKKTIDAEENLLHEEVETARALSEEQAATAQKELAQTQGMEDETKGLMLASRQQAIDAGSQAVEEVQAEIQKAQNTVKISEMAFSKAEAARSLAEQARQKAADLEARAQEALVFFSDWGKNSSKAPLALVAMPAAQATAGKPVAPAPVELVATPAAQTTARTPVAAAPVALLATPTARATAEKPVAAAHVKMAPPQPAAAAAPVAAKATSAFMQVQDAMALD